MAIHFQPVFYLKNGQKDLFHLHEHIQSLQCSTFMSHRLEILILVLVFPLITNLI